MLHTKQQTRLHTVTDGLKLRLVEYTRTERYTAHMTAHSQAEGLDRLTYVRLPRTASAREGSPQHLGDAVADAPMRRAFLGARCERLLRRSRPHRPLSRQVVQTGKGLVMVVGVGVGVHRHGEASRREAHGAPHELGGLGEVEGEHFLIFHFRYP